jgi:hypothetical protein
MDEIDRTVIGGNWRRWHPVNPMQMKRHADNPKSSAASDLAAKFSPANHGID